MLETHDAQVMPVTSRKHFLVSLLLDNSGKLLHNFFFGKNTSSDDSSGTLFLKETEVISLSSIPPSVGFPITVSKIRSILHEYVEQKKH